MQDIRPRWSPSVFNVRPSGVQLSNRVNRGIRSPRSRIYWTKLESLVVRTWPNTVSHIRNCRRRRSLSSRVAASATLILPSRSPVIPCDSIDSSNTRSSPRVGDRTGPKANTKRHRIFIYSSRAGENSPVSFRSKEKPYLDTPTVPSPLILRRRLIRQRTIAFIRIWRPSPRSSIHSIRPSPGFFPKLASGL